MVEANESGMSQWLGGKEKEERKDGLIGMEARKGARGKSPAPSFAMRFPVDSVVQLFRRSANPARRVA